MSLKLMVKETGKVGTLSIAHDKTGTDVTTMVLIKGGYISNPKLESPITWDKNYHRFVIAENDLAAMMYIVNAYKRAPDVIRELNESLLLRYNDALNYIDNELKLYHPISLVA